MKLKQMCHCHPVRMRAANNGDSSFFSVFSKKLLSMDISTFAQQFEYDPLHPISLMVNEPKYVICLVCDKDDNMILTADIENHLERIHGISSFSSDSVWIRGHGKESSPLEHYYEDYSKVQQ